MLNRRLSFLVLMLAALCFAVMGCGDDDDDAGGGGAGEATVPGSGGGPGGGGPGGGGPGGGGPGGGGPVDAQLSAFCDDICALDDQCGELDSDFTLADCIAECNEDIAIFAGASASCRNAVDAVASCITSLNCEDYIDYLDEISDPYPCQTQEEALEVACADEFGDFSFGDFSSFSSFGDFSSFSSFSDF